MKIFLIVTLSIAALAIIFGFTNRALPKSKSEMSSAVGKRFYDLSYVDINGENVSMRTYREKYVLCVNVASNCGNTDQYSALEKLYKQYGGKLVIIAFPCNQFGGQEPGREVDIKEFCTKNYGVTFPLASKIDVKGPKQHEVYAWLTNKDFNEVSSDPVEWNFHKYLISPDGRLLGSFKAGMDPMSTEITSLIDI